MTDLEARLWHYRARLARKEAEGVSGVVDGDTIWLLVDLSRRQYAVVDFRLLGVNSPELKRATRVAGLSAKAFTQAWMDEAHAPRPPLPPLEFPLVIRSEKAEKYGRWLARVWRIFDGRCLNDDLIEAGHAVPYMTEEA